MTLPAYLTTAEAAEYLRLKERKVYDRSVCSWG